MPEMMEATDNLDAALAALQETLEAYDIVDSQVNEALDVLKHSEHVVAFPCTSNDGKHYMISRGVGHEFHVRPDSRYEHTDQQAA